MKPLNITIISSVIYPRISPRSLRATELAKEIVRQGHNVTLYGVLGTYDYSSFEKKYNLKVKRLKPSNFTMINSDGKVYLSLWKKGIIYLLNKWFEFPDIIISKTVYKALKDEKPDILITVALPFPIHWGTAFAKKYQKHLSNTLWVSDCGDPYMGTPMAHRPFYFKYIEKFWCRQTDYITVPLEQAKEGYYKEFRDKIRVIPQGFNFEDVVLLPYIKNNIPHFAYSGTVYPQSRDPRTFLEYLCTVDKPFKFIVYTNRQEVFTPYVEKLSGKIEIRNYVPHEELLKELSKMDFLINIKNESSVQQPSKLIDYYLTKRPIIEITSAFNEKDIFEEFIKGDYTHQLICNNIEDYNIKNIANKFLNLYKGK